MNLMQGDCLELMKQIPDRSVDLVLTDPPYNISVATSVNGKDVVNSWDKIDNYIDWCIKWLTLCSKKLKPNGVLYFWHNESVRRWFSYRSVSGIREIHTAQGHGTGVIPMAARLCVHGSTPANTACTSSTLRRTQTRRGRTRGSTEFTAIRLASNR